MQGLASAWHGKYTVFPAKGVYMAGRKCEFFYLSNTFFTHSAAR